MTNLVKVTYSESLAESKTLYQALLDTVKEKNNHIYVKRTECDLPDWEGLWDRTKRMREERDPRLLGGKKS